MNNRLIQLGKDMHSNVDKAQSIIESMRGAVSRRSAPVQDKDVTLTANQMQALSDGQGKVIYMGAHPKRTS